MSKLVSILVVLQFILWKYKLRLLAKLLSVANRILFSCQVSPGAEFGKGSILAYGGLGVVIHGAAKIGRGVVIGTNVTIGGNFGKGGVPRIGDNVYIASGAKIYGPIVIGDNSVIGSNVVITKSIPPGSVVKFTSSKIEQRNA